MEGFQTISQLALRNSKDNLPARPWANEKKKIHTHIQKIIIIIVALLLPALYRTGVKAVIPKLHQAPLHKVVCSSGEQIPCTKDITGKAGRGWGDRT